MNTINIEKRFEERLAVIRRAAEGLPAGKRNCIINNCAKLAKYAKVAGNQLKVGHYRHANYDARTQEDMAEQAMHKKEVWAALLAGRVVSLEDNFKTSEFHTIICRIRQEITLKNLPYVLCDEWYRPGEGRRPFKKYWLQNKDLDNE